MQYTWEYTVPEYLRHPIQRINRKWIEETMKLTEEKEVAEDDPIQKKGNHYRTVAGLSGACQHDSVQCGTAISLVTVRLIPDVAKVMAKE